MLKKIIDEKLTSYYDSFDTWQEAVIASYQGMLKKGIISEEYINEVLSSIEEFGPYVVISPLVAMPHSTTGSKNVFNTAFSFMKVNKPVVFDENDRSKDAKVFFSFAAAEENEHLKNIVKLAELLINEKIVEELLEVTCDEDLLKLIEKHEA